MRNYELIKTIWLIINMKSPTPSAKLEAIENLIKKERSELESEKHYPQQDAGIDY